MAALGVDGLLKAVAQIDSSRPSEMIATLIRRIREVDSPSLGDHDATVLLCRATDRPVGWRDNLLAPLRLLRSVTEKTQLD